MPDNCRPEKRKFVRFLIAIPLKYARMGIRKLGATCTHNISAQGLSLVTIEELPVNTSLDLSLKIPDNGEDIPLEAEVVWTQQMNGSGYRSGLKIRNTQIKPIPLVLRTINSRL